MQNIEIRQNKKTLIPMLAILAIALIGMTYYIYFSGRVDNKVMKIIYVFLNASLIYAIYIPSKKFFKNEPVLTFTKSEIEINQSGKPVAFLWLQITDWKIEKDDTTHYLIVEAAETKLKINISWLDKNPGQIEELFRDYKSGNVLL